MTTVSAALCVALLALLPWCCGVQAVAPLTALALSGMLAMIAGRGHFSRWARIIALAWVPLALSLFIVHGLFTPNSPSIIASFGPFDLTLEGLALAWRFAGRLLIVIAPAAFLVTAVPADDLIATLSGLRMPPDVVLVLQVALNTLPSAMRRAGAIRDAQRARGLEPSGGPLSRARAAPALLAPLALGMLMDAETRAIALEMRGARLDGPRTRLRQLPDGPRQRSARRIAPLVVLGLVLAAHALVP